MTFPPLLAVWVHDLSPFAIRFGEHAGIRWYGLAYVVGFLLAMVFFAKAHRAGRAPFDADARADLFLAIVVGVMVGGRLGSVFLYSPEVLAHDPLAVFRIWEGGMASHGGMVGLMVAAWWAARRFRQPFLRVTDLLVSIGPAGVLLGRIANFVNGELAGRVTDVPWAVIFPDAPTAEPRHPSQLYAAGLEGALLLAWLQWRFWRAKPGELVAGRLSAEFCLGYAAVRVIGEQFREPDAGLILGMTRGTFYSLFLVALGLGILAWTRGRGASTPLFGPARR